MRRSERARWIFSRQLVGQLGFVKETERLGAENQIKLLFELWDSDNSGTIEVNELIHGLIRLGHGGSPNFTKIVLGLRIGDVGHNQSDAEAG
jgi:hypothetical protein